MIISICLLSIPAFGYTYNANSGEGGLTLDGSWQSEGNWDGLGIGGGGGGWPDPVTGKPGGAEIQTDTEEVGASYLRFQNPGATRDHGLGKANHNWALELDEMGLVSNDSWMDNGEVSVQVKWRLSSELDNANIDQWMSERYTGVVKSVDAWPIYGEGQTISDGGKGMLTLHQNTGDANGEHPSGIVNAGKQIGLSITRIDDDKGAFVASDENGQISTFDGSDSDFMANLGHQNVIYFDGVDDWHVWDIQVAANGIGEAGTHTVTVSMDGNPMGQLFVTAAGNGDDPSQTLLFNRDGSYDVHNTVGIGSSSSNHPCAFDLDYITVTPEPMTIALMGLGGLGLLRRRRA